MTTARQQRHMTTPTAGDPLTLQQEFMQEVQHGLVGEEQVLLLSQHPLPAQAQRLDPVHDGGLDLAV